MYKLSFFLLFFLSVRVFIMLFGILYIPWHCGYIIKQDMFLEEGKEKTRQDELKLFGKLEQISYIFRIGLDQVSA